MLLDKLQEPHRSALARVRKSVTLRASRGWRASLLGGAVRDLVIGRQPHHDGLGTGRAGTARTARSPPARRVIVARHASGLAGWGALKPWWVDTTRGMCNDEEMTDKLVVLTPEDIFDLGRAVNVATVAGTSRLSPERSAQLQQALAAAVPAGPRYLLVARDSNSDGRDTLEIVTAASYCHLLPGADRQAVAKLETFATAPSAATVTDLAHARARLRGEQGERS